MKVKSVSIITKKNNAEADALALVIERYLRSAEIEVYNTGLFAQSAEMMERLHLTDLVLVLGGDGTIVRVARALAGTGTPVAGINFGAVGFLAELGVNNWPEALEKMLAQGFNLDRRMGLHLSVQRTVHRNKRKNDAPLEEIFSGYAVNDVVLSRSGVARLLALDLFIDGEPAAFWRADGIIIATPTGSSGYTGSAGGPLMSPSLNAYAVTAICPFLSRALPMVLPESSTLGLAVRSDCTDSIITVDGQEAIKLKTGDVIQVKGAAGAICFANFGLASYFGKLHSSGLLQDSGRS